MLTKEDIKLTVPEETYTVSLPRYRITLGVRTVDTETKQFISKDIGTYEIVTGAGTNNYRLIHLAKRIYPEVSLYKNVEILHKEMKHERFDLPLEEIMNAKLRKGENHE